jgi:putative acetyltransferase
VIRPERPGDENAIRAVETAAFGRDDEAKIVDDLRAGGEYIPELSLVVEEQGAIVGHVMLSRCHVEASGDLILLLGPIGVVPER